MLDLNNIGPKASEFDEDVLGIIDRLEEEPDADERRNLARKALTLNPGCVEALWSLANDADTRVERIALLKEIARLGMQELIPASKQDPEFSWWHENGHLVSPRYFMAAVAALGDDLKRFGDMDGSRSCYELLLEIDPADRLQVADRLQKLASVIPPARRR